MAKYLLHPCPNCDASMHLPAMPSIECIIEGLMAETGGKCPLCGEQVVVDEPPPPRAPYDPFAEAQTPQQVREIKIVDLPLSVRCRLALTKTDSETLGDILNHGRHAVLKHLGESSACAHDLCRLLAKHSVVW
jgi:hypothetical protein